MLNKIKIVLGSFMVLLLVFGSLFKIMHWPYASSLIVLSILVFAFGLLPIFVYAKFKKSRYQFS